VNTVAKTRTAARYAIRHTNSDLTHTRAAVLLKRLHACDAALASGNGDVPAIVHSVLRSLVLAARDLAGPAWLTARADDPDIAAFTALQTAPAPPTPADLDEIISRVLWARFAPYGTHRGGTSAQQPDATAAVPVTRWNRSSAGSRR
jgi:hypothetical protein